MNLLALPLNLPVPASEILDGRSLGLRSAALPQDCRGSPGSTDVHVPEKRKEIPLPVMFSSPQSDRLLEWKVVSHL